MTIILGLFFDYVTCLTAQEYILIKSLLSVLFNFNNRYCIVFNCQIYLFFISLFEVIINSIFFNRLFCGAVVMSVLKLLFSLLFYTFYIFFTNFIFINLLFYYKNSLYDILIIESTWVFIFFTNEFYGFVYFWLLLLKHAIPPFHLWLVEAHVGSTYNWFCFIILALRLKLGLLWYFLYYMAFFFISDISSTSKYIQGISSTNFDYILLLLFLAQLD